MIDLVNYDEIGVPYEDEETGEGDIFFNGKHVTKSDLTPGILIPVLIVVLVIVAVVTLLIVKTVKKKRG